MNRTDEPLVVMHGVTKTYGAVRAVDGLDLEIRAGETVALLGPNGAGKSTSIDLMLGLARPDTGEISVVGSPPGAAAGEGKVGAMLQNGGLPSLTKVEELVELMAGLYPRTLPTQHVMDQAQISDVADRFVSDLSGGQAQRVRFALASTPDPDLLILDEPTAGMDADARRSFWQAMNERALTGKTTLFATHYLAEADNEADRIVVMHRGRVVADGTPSQVRSRVGGQRVRARLPEANPDELRALPGVTQVEMSEPHVTLRTTDRDRTIKALVSTFPSATDVQLGGADLEQAFFELTKEI
jgi:ABC-2 type transport system ATP-binding protein